MAELVMSFKKNPERKCIVTPCFITATRDFYNEEKVPLPEEFVIGAIWDTGATTSAISKGVIDFLGLQPTGKKERLSSANGTYESDTYFIDLYLSEDLVFKNMLVNEMPKDSRLCAIVGLDIILQSDFFIESEKDSFVVKFRYPAKGSKEFSAKPVNG